MENTIRSTFKAPSKNLFQIIRKFNKLIPSLKKTGRLKVVVQPHEIELSSYGVSFSVACETEGFADIFVPYNLMLAIAQTEKSETIKFVFEEGKMLAGHLEFHSKEIRVNTWFSSAEIVLPLNFRNIDLLRMERKYTPEELSEQRLLLLLAKAHEKLNDDIEAAFRILRAYDVTAEKLRALVDAQIGRGSD